jgi:hypothetical protein
MIRIAYPTQIETEGLGLVDVTVIEGDCALRKMFVFLMKLFFKMAMVLVCALGISSLAQDINGSTAIGQIYNVTSMGAYGDGVHDDTAAIQNALNTGATTAQEIYFPCGTYLVSTPLLFTVPPQAPPQIKQTGSIEGENAACAVIKYVGIIPGPVITVTTGLVGNYFSGFAFGDITILGNSVTTDDVLLVRPSHFAIENLFLWGANSTSGDCLQIQEGIGGKIDTLACSGNISPDSTLPPPNVGLFLTGVNATDQTGALTILNPIVEGVQGTGVLFRSSSLIFMAGCQISMNKQSLYIDDNSYKNNISNCLFEDSPQASYVGGYSNVLDNCTFSYFAGTTDTVDLQLGGRQNVVSNTMVQWGTSVLATATQSVLDNDLFGTPPSDAGNGTQISNATYANTQANISYPQSVGSTFTQPGFIGAGVTSSQTITGSWIFTPGPTSLSYTVFPTKGSWRALLIGKFGGSGSASVLEALPTYLELTESANTVQLPTAKVTFAVNSAGLFSATGGTGAETFNGTIFFMLNAGTSTSGPNSAKFAGTLTATGVAAATLSTYPFPPNGFNYPASLVGGELGYLYLPYATGTAGICRGGSVAGGMDDGNFGGIYIRALDSPFSPCGSERYENTLGVFHDAIRSLAPILAPSASFGAIQLTSIAGMRQCLQVDASGNVSGTGAYCSSTAGTRDYYWKQMVSAASPHRGTKCGLLGYSSGDACQGSVQLPGPMPDSNYITQCSGFDNEQSQLAVGVIGTDLFPTTAGGNIYVNVGVIHSFYGSGLRSVMVACHAHHD